MSKRLYYRKLVPEADVNKTRRKMIPFMAVLLALTGLIAMLYGNVAGGWFVVGAGTCVGWLGILFPELLYIDIRCSEPTKEQEKKSAEAFLAAAKARATPEFLKSRREYIAKLQKEGCEKCGSKDRLVICARGSLAKITAQCFQCNRDAYFHWLGYMDATEPDEAKKVRDNKEYYIGEQRIGIDPNLLEY